MLSIKHLLLSNIPKDWIEYDPEQSLLLWYRSVAQPAKVSGRSANVVKGDQARVRTAKVAAAMTCLLAKNMLMILGNQGG